MICLTGDLHHTRLGTGNQKACDVTEIQTAQRYLRLCEQAGVKVTFFVSGQAFADEWADLAPICAHPLVEIGGHNYSCLTPVLYHRVCKKLFGSYNGPAWSQRMDAVSTIRIIEKKSGHRIRAWRNHMYMHGPHTERVLAGCGITVCSDGVKRASRGPERHESGVWNLPLNVIPDHEHLYHAERTPEWVAAWVQRYNWSDDFGSRSYYIDEWVAHVIDGLREQQARGAVATLIIHPITMYLCDRFKGVRRILEYIATQETVHVSELVDITKAKSS